MRDGFLWLLIVAYGFVTVVVDSAPATFASPANLPLGILIPLLFALVHGAIRYGATGITVFLVLCLGISNVMENVGVLTGFPFGRYYYTDVLGPKLFLVPLLIGPAYFGTGYLSWVLATVLLDADRRRDALATVAVPVVATFIMVGWDLCLDPGSSTIARIWVWQDGGPYFGVPFVNYLGWALTVFLFFMAFARCTARRGPGWRATLPPATCRRATATRRARSSPSWRSTIRPTMSGWPTPPSPIRRDASGRPPTSWARPRSPASSPCCSWR